MQKVMAGVTLCAMFTFVPAAALAAGIDGAGSPPTCPARGNLKFKPALVTSGVEPGTVKVSAKSSAACSGGYGDGATIASYKVKAAGTASSNTCGFFGGASSSDLALTFKWKVAKGSPKLNDSTATFSIQPGGQTPGGSQTFDLVGTITAGSFVGEDITAHIASDETAATLLAACDEKGIKKINFGLDGQTASCLNGPDMAAAITKQITSIDGNDVPHLELELITLTASPFRLSATDITNPAGIQLESIETTTCGLESPGRYRCRHSAYFVSTGACQWDGGYDMNLAYSCDPTNTCDLCEGSETVGMTLDSENFCSVGTAFCVTDLSCSESIASGSTGGVPCCSGTYTPLIQCLEASCSSQCSAVISGDAGIATGSPCDFCSAVNCNPTRSACSADTEECPAD